MSWQWVAREVVFAVHDKQLAVHGGLGGIRDLNAVESAINRAQNPDAYGNPPPDVADLAAAYIYGMATSYGFSDGNKRTAYVALKTFILLNGCDFPVREVDAVIHMLKMAAGEESDEDFIDWVRGVMTVPR